MVWQLRHSRPGWLVAVIALAMLTLAQKAAAEPLLRSEKQYRLAAWHFYQDDYYQALLQLAFAPDTAAKASLLEAGLLLQLDMPAATAALLQRLLADKTLGGDLPRQLRNIALLQFSRYQYEQQQPALAATYLGQLTPPLNELAGQAELLNQLLNWPSQAAVDPDIFKRLAGQPELPYIVINQILTLRQQQEPQLALQLLARLTQQLQRNQQPSFWQQLFTTQPSATSDDNNTEIVALADYLQLLKAGLLVDQTQWADAQQVLAGFASNSVLTLPAMMLYRDVLTENRQIPALLAVLQQLIGRYPYAEASWQAAHQLGIQFERTLQHQDALAAYRWAEQYYQQQLAANAEYAVPVSIEQLAKPETLSGWQQYQLGQYAPLYQLERQLAALQTLQQLQQQRLARMETLSGVVQGKLLQQQQLLAAALPELKSKQDTLQRQVEKLRVTLTAAEAEPMALSMWLDSTEQNSAQQHQMILKAESRLKVLAAADRDIKSAQQRLARLRGILQWSYQQNSSERQWQLQNLQQQLATELSYIEQGLRRLGALDGKTERLLAQQQQLSNASAAERQFAVALSSQQQVLLARLNDGMQQLRQTERSQLLQMQRLNTQAIARVMEQLLLTSQEGQ